MALRRLFSRRALPGETPLSEKDKAHESIRKRYVRETRVYGAGLRALPFLVWAAVLSGLGALVLLPTSYFSRGHYISENALQPGQVNAYWSSNDAFVFRQYLKKIDDITFLSAEERAQQVCGLLSDMGLECATQSYLYTSPSTGELTYGTNAYAILRAPKTDGVESVVLSASWMSRNTELVNVTDATGAGVATLVRSGNERGVAFLLALTNYVQKFAFWSKDIIVLISDEFDQGAQAFVDGYHAYEGSGFFENRPKMTLEDITLRTGPIWAALNVDIPSELFESVGLFYEGADGSLANLDFVNMASLILKLRTLPPILHNSPFPSLSAFWGAHAWLEHALVYSERLFSQSVALRIKVNIHEYISRWDTILHQLARSSASQYIHSDATPGADIGSLESWNGLGPEAVYSKFRIDSLTLFCIPSSTVKENRFLALGWAVESILRSLNNLLERFHQSFFLYIMTSVDTFTTVGIYLYGPILIGAGLTFSALHSWVRLKHLTTDPSLLTQLVLSSFLLLLASHLLALLFDYLLFYQVIPISLSGFKALNPKDVFFAFLLLLPILSAPCALSYALHAAQPFPVKSQAQGLATAFVTFIWAGLLSAVLSTLHIGVGFLCTLAGLLALFNTRLNSFSRVAFIPFKIVIVVAYLVFWQRRAWYWAIPLFWISELV